jgi:pseudaminic acid synthase
VSLGACLIEKHLTLSRVDGGPDSAFSLEPDEFRDMVRAIREAEQALGAIRYGPSPCEEKSRVFRRSLFVTRDVRAGEPLTHDNVRSIRPGHGLPPDYMEMVLGRVATKDIERGTPVSWALIGGPPDPAHSD